MQDKAFLRLRIGIGHPGHKDAVTRYVLGRAPKQIKAVVGIAIDKAVSVIPLILGDRVQDAMTALHTEQ